MTIPFNSQATLKVSKCPRCVWRCTLLLAKLSENRVYKKIKNAHNYPCPCNQIMARFFMLELTGES
jgi:hypothetical protein